MRFSLRNAALSLLLVGGVAYGVLQLRGPNGVSALVEKRREIQSLERENELLHREIEAKKARIERLKNNPEEQEMEIRKELKLMKPGEKSYIMQEPTAR